MQNLNANSLNEIPKKFIQNGICGYSKECFIFLFTSGIEEVGFGTTPMQMKAFFEMFKQNLEAYEKEFGPIEAPKGLVASPLQMGDINKK